MRHSSVQSLFLSSMVIVVLLGGCGGGPQQAAPPTNEQKSGQVILRPATMEQLRRDCAALGKTVPAFLQQLSQPTVQPANLMESLSLFYWSATQCVPGGRASWFECYLSNPNYPTDVSMTALGGDPDLFVFSPLITGEGDLGMELIGYDIRVGGGHVGSFYPRDFGGRGRYVAAVYGYRSGSNYFRIRFW